MRFPEELEARVVALAEAQDRSFSYVVLRALEKALDGGSVAPVVPVSRGDAAPSRASEPAPSEPLAKKDPLANVPGLKRGSEVPYRKPFVPRPKGG